MKRYQSMLYSYPLFPLKPQGISDSLKFRLNFFKDLSTGNKYLKHILGDANRNFWNYPRHQHNESLELRLHKKWSFPLCISSVNVRPSLKRVCKYSILFWLPVLKFHRFQPHLCHSKCMQTCFSILDNSNHYIRSKI